MRKATTWVTATIPSCARAPALANVGAAVSADSYILMGEDATKSYADGKIKAELGDDPEKDRPLRVLLLHFQPDRVGAPTLCLGISLPRICLRMRGSPT